MTVLVSL